MEIGKNIKRLRKEKGSTQEDLANFLGISIQAISKWENGFTAPDIIYIPDIANYFGVSIDELFSITNEIKVDRIENRMDYLKEFTDEEFNKSVICLEEIIKGEKNRDIKAKAYENLAWLYIHRANSSKLRARETGEKALEDDPTNRQVMKSINMSLYSPLGDWNIFNHDSIITFYKEYVEKYPEIEAGYWWLLDYLIADYRIDEAKIYLEKYIKLINSKGKDEWRIIDYKINILLKEDNKSSIEELQKEMIDKFKDKSGPYFELGCKMANYGKYEEALEYFEREFELEEKPRFIDSLEAIGKINEILGRKKTAIETYERLISMLKEDRNIIEGESVDIHKRRIEKIKNSL